MSSPSLPSSPLPSEDLSVISSLPNSGQLQLTPRSKVKALLAAIDDDSDSERGVPPRKLETKEANYSSGSASATQGGELDTAGESEEEESDEAPIIPRGRLAARLYRRGENTPDPSISGKDNVYERIKHQLLPKSNTKLQGALSESRPKFNGGTGESNPDPPDKPQNHRGDSSTQSTPRSRRTTRSATMEPRMDSNIIDPIEAIDESGSDLPAEPQHNAKLKSLVTRKREEFRAKEAAKEQKAAKRKRLSYKHSDVASISVGHAVSKMSEDSASDQIGESRLTQQTRPTRKASKKALLEMNRETQRMSRNMQLAHQAMTKKKVTKESFLSRFNFPHPTQGGSNLVQAQSSSTVVSSAPASDKEALSANDSPPTSPLRADEMLHNHPATTLVHELPANKKSISIGDIEAVLPDNLSLLHHTSKTPPKRTESSGLGSLNEMPLQANKVNKIKFPNIPAISNPSYRSMSRVPDSDSDIEIVPRWNPKRSLKIFDRLPAHKFGEERPLQNLRALAHLNSPGKRLSSSKATYTMSEMQDSLQRKARKQAAEERAAKIQHLKDRGVIVQSAEDRERDQAAVEDLVDRARKEAAAIMKKEKDAAKKGINMNEANVNDLSSDEDEDFDGDDADESDVDFSESGDEDGSLPNDDGDMKIDEPQSWDEDEAQGEAEEEIEEGIKPLPSEPNPIGHFNAEASGNEKRDGKYDRIEDDDSDDLVNMNAGYINGRRSRRVARVIDDEDDSKDEAEEKPPTCSGPIGQKPFIPGLTFSNAMAMGMTQAFAATMADSQSQAGSASGDVEQDSLELLGPMPEPAFPLYDLEDSHPMVLDSQAEEEQPNGDVDGPTESSMEITIDFSQSQVPNMAEDTRCLPVAATQFSEIPDPTQDVGFEKSSPIRNRFVSVPPSTVDTVILSGVRNTPVVKRKGRLHRRTSLSMDNLDANEGASVPDTLPCFTVSTNAFDVLKQNAKKLPKAADMFDKKQSEARAMVEDQAQESEDEYAGLGGASDDESAGEEDEEVRKMIDEGEVEVDERKLAAFYANKERASDEKAVERLFKDLNNGGLRRKRGAEFDLSDSDDDGEARRRAKRREFAKMRKALFENENIGKIAEDPKKLAFLRAIEDREYDENYDLFDEPESSLTNVDNTQEDDNNIGGTTKSQAQQPNSTTSPHLPASRQRPLQDSHPDKINRPGPGPATTKTTTTAALPRSRAFKKPSTLADIRASVSFLLEEPDSISLQQQNHPPTSSPPPSDTEPQPPTTTSETTLPNPHRRPPTRPPPTTTIIDRLSLKRAQSASITTSSSSFSRLAFHNPTTSCTDGTFKPPSLLRRATTTSTFLADANAGTDQHGISVATTERAAGGSERRDVVVRMGGTRKSSVGYFARGREREEERARRMKKKKRGEGMGMGKKRVGGAEGEMGGLRGLVMGRFE